MAPQPRETRIHGSLLAAAEKRLLIRMAVRHAADRSIPTI